jgi:hypothetical protein
MIQTGAKNVESAGIIFSIDKIAKQFYRAAILVFRLVIGSGWKDKHRLPTSDFLQQPLT